MFEDNLEKNIYLKLCPVLCSKVESTHPTWCHISILPSMPCGKEKPLILRTVSLKQVTCIFNLSTESTLNGEAIFTKVSGGLFLATTANSVVTP